LARVISIYLILAIAVITTARAITFDFISGSELNSFEKLMIDENGNFSALNTFLATITIEDGFLKLKNGKNLPAVALPYNN